ncbi:MAG: hypothetical protein DWQ36_18655 [Acidobacteria bacterium]|nr:MAG: hypothetical protein DWQ30_11375 [Acidobacteriota bacterium]REK03889.1 MAG: hypothetical protein DWQ36_18655 [Acidobacteriota bacterium]
MLPTSVDDVRQGTARAWNDYLVPVYERIVGALPTVLSAIGILILFWIVAVVVGWTVTRLLSMTELDNRLARDLGMQERLRRWEEKGTSLEKVAGTAVKWVILLFGFVAFFEKLDLVLVAGPLGEILAQLTAFIPNLLKALAYLALYWVVGTLLKLGITRGLQAVDFDERAGRWVKSREVKGEKIGPSAMVGRLVFYVVLLFGLPPFLEALGQEAAVAPLRDMMSEFFGFLPNVVAALILVFVGRVVATIVREIVTNFLAATGADGFAQRFGIGSSEGSRKLSEIVGAVAFFFTIIPILVAAVDALEIEAISEPVKGTLEQVLAAVPLIVVAMLVMGVGYFVARTVRGLVENFLKGVGFDSLPGRIGLGFMVPKEGAASLSAIAGNVVMVIILLLTAQQALSSLQLDRLAELLGGLLAYLPNLFVGVVIILAAISLGNYVGGLLSSLVSGTGHGKLAGTVARYAIYFLGFSMGLSQLGVADEVVRIAVGAVLGGTALALGIAFGLGGRDRAKQVIDDLGSSR